MSGDGKGEMRDERTREGDVGWSWRASRVGFRVSGFQTKFAKVAYLEATRERHEEEIL